MGVDREKMSIILTIEKKMGQAVWLHEVQEFVKALRAEKYKALKEKEKNQPKD